MTHAAEEDVPCGPHCGPDFEGLTYHCPSACCHQRSAENDVPRCGTCGLVREEPDEPIEPGDYWKIDAATAAGRRCPKCWQFPGTSVTPSASGDPQ